MAIKRDESLEKNWEPTHPGEIIEDYMNYEDITQKELAERMNISRNRINRIINRERGISADTAHRLARVFDTTAKFWMNLDAEWKLWETKEKKDNELNKITPIKKAG